MAADISLPQEENYWRVTVQSATQVGQTYFNRLDRESMERVCNDPAWKVLKVEEVRVSVKVADVTNTYLLSRT